MRLKGLFTSFTLHSSFLYSSLFILHSSLFIFTSCVKDDTNYDYPTQEELDGYTIQIDTTGCYLKVLQLNNTWYQDSVYTFHVPGVKYAYPENLCYRWFVIDYPYQAVTTGNTTTYPAADTICTTLDLSYTCKLAPGNHRLYLQVEDSVLGIKKTMQITKSNYFTVGASGAVPSGVYCLEVNQDGLVDVDIVGTVDALIFGEFHEKNFYTRNNPDDPIKGTPVVFYMSAGTGWNPLWYYIGTTEELRRVSTIGFTTMDKNEELFYQAPENIRPQAFSNINSCDFMINDGKFFCLYSPNEANRKFPVALPGNYNLAPYLCQGGSYSRYYAVDGAMKPYQVLWNNTNKSLVPYYQKNTDFSQFITTLSTAKFHYDNAPKVTEVLYYAMVNGGDALLITKEDDGNIYANIIYFFNAVDNGNLCSQRVNLTTACPEIDKAEHFIGSTGTTFFYSVGNKLYEFVYGTGATSGELLETFDADEQITCISTLPSGGWPTGGYVVYVATWSDSTKKGKLYHALFSPTTGKYITSGYAPDQEEGMNLVDDEFGKIYSIDYSTHTTLY